MLLKTNWKIAISKNQLNEFLDQFEQIIPRVEYIFNVFRFVEPKNVRCVILGEDPFPRIASAYGVSFWDKEISDWSIVSRGNSLKHIQKALLIYLKKANYYTSVKECRKITKKINFPNPDELFFNWLNKGVLLLNTALTFSSKKEKVKHFEFWNPIIKTLLNDLNNNNKPFFILWGGKAQTWESQIENISENQIIRNGHPCYQHHFLRKNDPSFSPFTEIIERTGIKFI